MHWPFAFAEKVLEKPPGTKQPLRLPDGSPNPIWTIRMEYTQTWAAMEKMVDAGKVRSLGVSNFTAEQLTHLGSVARIQPAVNQIEVHPYLQQQALVEHCIAVGVKVMAYSPLGSAMNKAPPCGALLEQPAVTAAAAESGRTAGQVLVRWGLQRYAGELVSIPKSATPARIASNLDVTDWRLSDGAMAAIGALECGFRCFISYLKKPDNDRRWHDGVIERGDDSDIVK